MSRRARLVIAAAVVVLSAIGIGVLVVQAFTNDRDDPRSRMQFVETDAVAPFVGYRETRLDLDGKCRRVVLAGLAAQRAEGLRGHVDLGPYAGMLFVNAEDSDGSYTMAGVTQPLDIAWYAADGMPVDSARMAACPNGDQAHCPIYRSKGRYRIALETPAGSEFAGSIAPC